MYWFMAGRRCLTPDVGVLIALLALAVLPAPMRSAQLLRNSLPSTSGASGGDAAARLSNSPDVSGAAAPAALAACQVPWVELDVDNSRFTAYYATESDEFRYYCFAIGGRGNATCSSSTSNCCPDGGAPPAIASLKLSVLPSCLYRSGLAALKRFKWNINLTPIKPVVSAKYGTLQFNFVGKKRLSPWSPSLLCLRTEESSHPCYSPKKLCGEGGCGMKLLSGKFMVGSKSTQCCVSFTMPFNPPAGGDKCDGGPCGAHGACSADTTTLSGYSCSCDKGWQFDGATCSDIDECSNASACGAHGNCTNLEGGYICTCEQGWEFNNATCVGVNQQPDQCNSSCGVHGACTLVPGGGHTCSCDEGWAFNNVTCADIDECSQAASPCGAHGACTNSPGSFTCACDAGWTFNGTTCTDINECSVASACGGHGACTNSPGSYSCACESGWAFNGTTCADVNECDPSKPPPCPAGTTCVNKPGGFTCGAGPGGATIDYCNATAPVGGNPCGPHGSCANAPGGGTYDCVCDAGYSSWADANGTKTCVDSGLLACEAKCGAGGECLGANGSYACTCHSGYASDNGTCKGCIAGHGGPSCAACAQGTFANGTSLLDQAPCTACDSGATTVGTGQASCSACLPGHGGADCGLCPVNSYSQGFLEGRLNCTKCPPSSIAPAVGASSCQRCPSGQVRDDTTGQCRDGGFPPTVGGVLQATTVSVAHAFRHLAQLVQRDAAPAAGRSRERRLAQAPPPSPTLKFAWDGNFTVAFDITIEGAAPNDSTVAAMSQRFMDVCITEMPVAEFVPYPLPPAKMAVLDITAAYDPSTHQSVFSGTGDGPGGFLDLVGGQLRRLYNFSLTTGPPGGGGLVSSVTMNSTVVSRVSVQLPFLGGANTTASGNGNGTARSAPPRHRRAPLVGPQAAGLPGNITSLDDLTAYLGVSFPVPPGVVTISNPSLVYTVDPIELSVQLLASVPLLKLDGVEGSLLVNTDKTAALLIPQTFTPITTPIEVSFNGLRLSSVHNATSNALVGQSSASFASVPFDLTTTLKSGQLAFTMTTRNLSMTTLICVFFNKSAGCSSVGAIVPEYTMNFLKTILFTSVALDYDSAGVGAKQYGIVAVPDMTKVPLFPDIMKFLSDTFGLDFSPNDVMLKLAPGEFLFGVFKKFNVTLGPPFTRPGETTASLRVNGATLGLEAACQLASALNLPGVEGPVGFDVLAVAGVSAADGVSFQIDGRTTTAIAFKDFPFIQVKEFAVGAGFSVAPLTLNRLYLQGAIHVFDASGAAAFLWEKNSGDLAFVGNVTNFSMQRLFDAWQIDIDLALFNIELRSVFLSFATRPVAFPGVTVPQGLAFKADTTMMRMDARADLALNSRGRIKYSVAFNLSELNRVLDGELQRAIDAELQSAAIGMIRLHQQSDQAEQALAAAQLAKEQARDALNQASTAFDSLVAPLLKAVDDASKQLDAAALALDAHTRKVYDTLDKATNEYNAASAELKRVKKQTKEALSAAKDAQRSARVRYDQVVDAAAGPFDAAVDAYNRLVDQYNSALDACSNVKIEIWENFRCAGTLALLAPMEAAGAALDTARGSYKMAAEGAEWAALVAARAAHEAARLAADRALSAAQASFDAARQTWQESDAVVRGIKASPVYKAWESKVEPYANAKASLDTAQSASLEAKAFLIAQINFIAANAAWWAAYSARNAIQVNIGALEAAMDNIASVISERAAGGAQVQLQALGVDGEYYRGAYPDYPDDLMMIFKVTASWRLNVFGTLWSGSASQCFYGGAAIPASRAPGAATQAGPAASTAARARPSVRWAKASRRAGLASAGAGAAPGSRAPSALVGGGVAPMASAYNVWVEPVEWVVGFLVNDVVRAIKQMYGTLNDYMHSYDSGSNWSECLPPA